MDLSVELVDLVGRIQPIENLAGDKDCRTIQATHLTLHHVLELLGRANHGFPDWTMPKPTTRLAHLVEVARVLTFVTSSV